MKDEGFLACAYCHGPVSSARDRETRQGSYSLQGAGHFCSRQCGRVFLSLQTNPVLPPEDVYSFRNPPLKFTVTSHRRTPSGIKCVHIAESAHEGHAIRMAAVYPFRATVMNWHSKRVFDNGKDIPGSAVA